MNKIVLSAIAFLLGSLEGNHLWGQQFSFAQTVQANTRQPETPEAEYIFYYKAAHAFLDAGFRDNQSMLDSLDTFLKRDNVREDTALQVRITAFCSVDNPYEKNEKLARKRADGFAGYLEKSYGISACKVDVDWVAEDWDYLERLVRESDMPSREQALEIIERIGIFDGREKKLMDLNGGEPYRYMSKHLFPELRRVQVVFIKKEAKQPFTEILPERAGSRRTDGSGALVSDGNADCECVPDTVKQEATRIGFSQELPMPSLLRAEKVKSHLYPMLAVKTDLARWAGLTPGFKSGTWMPNLSAEVFFGRRWSAEAGAMYANWNGFDGRLFAVSGADVFVRFWLKEKSVYRGFYVGAGGCYGQFNREMNDQTGRSGSYYGGGLTVGYAQSLSRHWTLELEARGIYRFVDSDYYDREAGHNYYNRSSSENKIVPSVRLNLVYRFGKRPGAGENRSR